MKHSRLRFLSAVMVLVLCINMGGCWDEKELDTLFIVIGAGVDANGDSDAVRFTVQVGKTQPSDGDSQKTSSEDGSYILLEATANNILAAAKEIKYENTRSISMQHNQMIIFGKALAEKGVEVYLDAFLRNITSRPEIWVLIADGNAKDVLSASLDQDKLPAVGLARMLEKQKSLSPLLALSLLDFVNALLDETTAPTVPLVAVDEGGSGFRLSELAVFKNGILISTLNEEETEGFMWTGKSIVDTNVDVITAHGSASLRVHTGHCAITPVLGTDGRPAFNMKIETTMQFGELHGFENMSVAEIIPELEKGAADTIKALVNACFTKTQTINADIYGFGAAVHRSFPKEWKKLKDQWDTLYPKVSLSVDVRASLTDTGEISGSLKMKEANDDANG